MFSFFKKKPILDIDSQQRIVAAIKEAEGKTSGEIRVFMEEHCDYMDAMTRAQEVFYNLGMEKTVARNAIIVYVALTDRQFALFGDKVIYEKAGGAQFWEKAAGKLSGHLRKNEITEGLSQCIQELGAALAASFPYDPAIKKNELPDEIVFGK
ncbi:MAG: hypothetical protein JWQ38_1430 [Flavipsychrobacter sp.]|nr:hypothetical protein [Flavipsychrobacter sp.]